MTGNLKYWYGKALSVPARRYPHTTGNIQLHDRYRSSWYSLTCPVLSETFYNHPVMSWFSSFLRLCCTHFSMECLQLCCVQTGFPLSFLPSTQHNCYYVAFRKRHGSDTLPIYNPYVSQHKNAKRTADFFRCPIWMITGGCSPF